MPRLLLISTCVAVLAAAGALLVAGRGDPSSEERYAEAVCSTILLRAQEILDIYENVNDTRAAPGRDARVTLWSLALDGRETTWNLRNELGALSVPDTEAGREAAGYVNSVARSALDVMTFEERRVRRLPERITLLQSIRGLDRLEQALSHTYTTMLTYDIVEVRVPALKERFEKAASCTELDVLGKD